MSVKAIAGYKKYNNNNKFIPILSSRGQSKTGSEEFYNYNLSRVVCYLMGQCLNSWVIFVFLVLKERKIIYNSGNGIPYEFSEHPLS